MKIVAKNRRARFDYEVVDTLTAGIVLTGGEVKSCRMGHVDLSGAYVSFRGDTVTIKHLKIAAYPFAAGAPHEPGRDRVLLLTRQECERLRAQSAEKGVTIIPLEVHAGRYIKVVLALVRGRKTIDKRRVIKERDIQKRLRTGKEI